MYIPDWWVWLIVNPVPTALTIVCFMTHTVVLVIQDGQTALDKARDGKNNRFVNKEAVERVVHYLESVGK